MSRVAQQALLGATIAPATISYLGLLTPTLVSGTTYSSTGAAIGAAAADRRVFCIVDWTKSGSPSSLSSATIGGVAATIHAQNKVASVFGLSVAIISALVPTGTTATVSLTFSAAASPGLGVYRVTGLQSATALDVISTGGSLGDPYSDTIDVAGQGILLFGGTIYSGATGFTVGGATEDFDINVASNTRMVGSSLAVTTTELGHTVSLTRSGGTAGSFGGAVVAASFR